MDALDLKLVTEEQRWAQEHNARLMREHLEDKKKAEAELSDAALEWRATPDHLRVCSLCGLKLSPVDVARITEKPTIQRLHDFCNPHDLELSSVAKGLVSLLRELYGDKIPLEAVKTLFSIWKSQKGRCHISQAQLSVPVKEPSFVGEESKPSKPTEPQKRPSLIDPLQWAMMENQRKKEEMERGRQAEIHQATIVDEGDGIRLVSKTVQSWREGLSDAEFAELVRTLFNRLPELQKQNILPGIGTSAASYVHRRSQY